MDGKKSFKSSSIIIQYLKTIFKAKHLLWISFILLLVPITLNDTSDPAAVSASQITPLVIGVAEWRQESGSFIDVQDNAYNTLNELIANAGLSEVTVIKLPVSMANARMADEIATKYKVDMILWGWYDPVAVRSYVDLADATDENGLSNSLDAFLKRGGSTQTIRVLKLLSELDYNQTGLYFCVPRWTP
jgi:hypothetical protein